MVELQSIFKKAYWSLAAGGLAYVAFIFALTYPEIQRLYDSTNYVEIQQKLTWLT